jgi:hypothetical protein
VPQTCTQLNSVCLLFVNTGERVYLNNVKGNFGLSMVKESCIHKLVKKIETTVSVLTRHAGGRKMCDRTVQVVSTCQFS